MIMWMWSNKRFPLLVFLLGIGQFTCAQEQTSPAAVLQDVESALTAQGEAISVCNVITSSEYRYRSGPARTRTTAAKVDLHINNGRFYQLRESTITRKTGAVSVRENEYSFDGRVFFIGHPSKTGDSTLLTVLGENPSGRGVDERLVKNEYLHAAGFFVPETPLQWRDERPGSLVVRNIKLGLVTKVSVNGNLVTLAVESPDELVLESRKVDLAAFEAELRSLDSDPNYIEQELTAIKSTQKAEPIKYSEFVLDASIGYALAQHKETTADGRLRFSVTASEHQKYALADTNTAIWLPKTCAIQSYFVPDTFSQHAETPYVVATAHLDSFSFSPRENEFALVYETAGTLVGDRSSAEAKNAPGGQINFTVDADADALRFAADSARSWRSLFIVLNMLLFMFLGIGVYFVLQKRKNAT